MHDLLCSPEIVASILTAATLRTETDTIDHSLLQICARVNRLFFQEATRLLWEKCGTGFPYSYSEPTVLALANIAARDVSRAQYYANYIRHLRFVRIGEDWPKPTEGEQWYDCLLSLHFPMLEFFTSDGRSNGYDSKFDAFHAAGPFYDFHSSERSGLFWHVSEYLERYILPNKERRHPHPHTMANGRRTETLIATQ